MPPLLHLIHTNLRIPGLEKEVRILHATDIHLAECDGRDPKQQKFLAWMNEHEGGVALTYFHLLLSEVSKLRPDFVALTGDFMHSATYANWEAFSSGLARMRVPYGLTLGNHDWDWPQHGTEERRPAYRERIRRRYLREFHRIPEFEHFSGDGVSFVFLDNSDYQVDGDQMGRLDTVLRRSRKIVLFYHIPVSVPSLRPATIEKWYDPILCGDADWEPLRRRRWYVLPKDFPSTRNFTRRILRHPGIAATFTGHLHIEHDDRLPSGARQFVTPALYHGYARLIALKPG